MRTEKQKMLAGELYFGFDEELLLERNRAKDLLFRYNNLAPSDKEGRKSILKDLFGQTGSSFLIEQPFACDYGYNIHIGENFFANHNCIILDGARVEIGDNALLAPNVSIYTVGHPTNIKERISDIEYTRPVTIGHNVWVGGDATILPGVTIGNNTVIGAGSVVTKNIPANVIAVGNPCKILRKLTPEELAGR